MIQRFVKMHGLGNDFVILDQRENALRLSENQIRMIADRRNGVGFDQMLCIEHARNPGAAVAFTIFNADGSQAEQCGNGIRCVARYIERKGLINSDKFLIQVNADLIAVRLEDDGSVSCDMGAPVFEPERIPLNAERMAAHYSLDVGGECIRVGAVSMGNPHAVVEVDDVDSAPVGEWGPLLEAHVDFPARANIGFMQIVTRNQIRLRVHERGVGETRACGTGACAAVGGWPITRAA